MSTILFLLLAAFTEPGVIPRQKDPLSEILKDVPFAHKQLILQQENKRKCNEPFLAFCFKLIYCKDTIKITHKFGEIL